MNSERPAMLVAETMLNRGGTAIGYLNAELLSESRLELTRRGLYAWTGALGIELAAVLIELDQRVPKMFWGLRSEIQVRGACYVVVPALNHLSTHPLVQGERVDHIQLSGEATVLSVDAFITATRLNL